MTDTLTPKPSEDGVQPGIGPVRSEVASAPKKQHRGFAAMSPEKRRELARKGGASLQPHQRSFSQDRALAASAGRVGGQNGVGPRKDGAQ